MTIANSPIQVGNKICELGESPVWDERRKALYWCDTLAGEIHRHSPTSDTQWNMKFPSTVGSFGLCESGRLIVACGMEILIADPDSGKMKTIATLPETDFVSRTNDGRVGPDGAFWVGTMHDVSPIDIQPLASLWRITATQVKEVVTSLKVSNGLAFTKDGTQMWHSDSRLEWVKRYPLNSKTGALGDADIVCSPNEEEGRPDGATFDENGIYWSAGVSAGVINGFNAGGKLVKKIEVPIPNPTMPCFGGEDLKTLYVTSHRTFLDDEERKTHPLAGGTFSLRMKVAGFVSPRFDDSNID